jgi:hypothetical protein
MGGLPGASGRSKSATWVPSRVLAWSVVTGVGGATLGMLVVENKRPGGSTLDQVPWKSRANIKVNTFLMVRVLS